EKLPALFVRADLLLGLPTCCWACRPAAGPARTSGESCAVLPFESSHQQKLDEEASCPPKLSLQSIGSLTARCAGNERGLGQFESSELERQTDGSPSRPRGLSSRHEPVATAYRAKQAIDRHKDADPTPNRPRASSKSFGARCGGVITCSQEDPPTL
ncbi:hypothetical protein BN1708_010279, partial [Verticillium longisporum]